MDYPDITKWKQTFFENTFSVDHCLSKYTQKSDLETLRKDLKKYGVELQLHMAEILKNETEAIVNLAENLTNLNLKIENLAVPISQLQEEIRTIHDLIQSAKLGYETLLSEVEDNNFKQNHVHLKIGIISTSAYINTVIDVIEADLFGNLVTLERIVTKYSFQKIYLDELGLMTPDLEKLVDKVEKKLVRIINNCFLESFEQNKRDVIFRCMRMYVNLQKESEAFVTFQRYILQPLLQPLFSEKNLEQCSHDLSKIYDNVKQILDIKLGVLSDIVNENPDLGPLNFVLHSFWKELDKQSREGLPHVTAPGNPEMFQKRFNSTYNLLKYIATKAGNANLVKTDNTFQDHLGRFNLPVYFEIKFQQIAGSFESDTIKLNVANLTAGNNPLSLKLKPSVALWKALSSCFNGDYYIDQLAQDFIKLSMMLLSRYLKLLNKYLLDVTSSDGKDKVDKFTIDALIDMSILHKYLAPQCNNAEDLANTLFAIINRDVFRVLARVLKCNDKAIGQVQGVFKEHIVSAKIKECTVQLQHVAAIPRLYRRTNRAPPKEASAYMVEAVKPILSFNQQFRTSLEKDVSDVVNNIVVRITRQYLSLVREVLESVCKTEESLRRLKSRTTPAASLEESSHTTSDTMPDETKIREQIKFDVGYFCDKLHPFGLSEAREAMELLKKEVYV